MSLLRAFQLCSTLAITAVVAAPASAQHHGGGGHAGGAHMGGAHMGGAHPGMHAGGAYHHHPGTGFYPRYGVPYTAGYRGVGIGIGLGYGLGYGGLGYGYGGYGYGGYGYGSGYYSNSLGVPAIPGVYSVSPSYSVTPSYSTIPSQPLNSVVPADPVPQPLPVPGASGSGAAAPATITVIASDGATVTFDGIETNQTGARHSFTTRPIDPGVEKRVSVKVDGPGGPATLSIGVRAGEKATVDMRK